MSKQAEAKVIICHQMGNISRILIRKTPKEELPIEALVYNYDQRFIGFEHRIHPCFFQGYQSAFWRDALNYPDQRVREEGEKLQLAIFVENETIRQVYTNSNAVKVEIVDGSKSGTCFMEMFNEMAEALLTKGEMLDVTFVTFLDPSRSKKYQMLKAASEKGWYWAENEATGEIDLWQNTKAADEEFRFTIPGIDYAAEMADYASKFNEEDYVRIMLTDKSQGCTGVPSLRVLVDEAEEIKEMVNDLASLFADFAEPEDEMEAFYREEEEKDLLNTFMPADREPNDLERYFAKHWHQMGFDPDAARLAKEASLQAVNSILPSMMNTCLEEWRDAGLHNADDIKKMRNQLTGAMYYCRCAIGQIVYFVSRGGVKRVRIIDATISKPGRTEYGCTGAFGDEYTPVHLYEKDLGDVWFLTEQEAKAKFEKYEWPNCPAPEFPD